jgi:membrane-bound lytic murein transglycosylase A
LKRRLRRLLPGPLATRGLSLVLLLGLAALSGCGTSEPSLYPASTPQASSGAPAAGIGTGSASPAVSPVPHLEAARFDDLPGWSLDSVHSALPALKRSCGVIVADAKWRPFCAALASLDENDDGALRATIEHFLLPYHVLASNGSAGGIVTGYYEPLLRGSKKKLAPYLTPLYGVPDDLIDVDLENDAPQTKGLRLRGKLVGKTIVPYPSRAELTKSNALAGKELVFVDDPVDAFFLQIQGSGRVQLFEHGHLTSTVRLAYADQNGQPYRSIGKWLIDQHELGPTEASMQGIKGWLARHPDRATELFNINPSVVFFSLQTLTDPNSGPKGALGVPLTAARSIAVDPQVVPLGVPVFLSTTEPNTTTLMQHLVVAQDSGTAIVTAPGTAVRVDVFFGSGDEAGELAGRMKQAGEMWLLLPRT